ncbi:MAG: ComF family protein, partial [Burkholderiaceae bacterium]|nr:ComF family protein [Burkholderiaceae bacterium]
MFDLLQKKARGWLGSLANTIPHTCAMCRAPCRSGICPRCREQYFGKPASRCRVCANRLTSQTPVCGACLRHPPPFDHAITATDYVPPVDQLVQSLKFSNRLGLAPSLAELLLLSIREQHPPNIALPSVLTVIPLSPPRLRDRGFNQSLEIARPLAQALQ